MFSHQPTIVYRPVWPSDLESLERIHAALFPIRYEREFFLNVVNAHGIVSWAAVDISGSECQGGELVGFVTTRIMSAKESEIEDLISYNASRNDLTLVYILTLGVVPEYRNLGIASSLVREVIKYASSISSCRAIYLHVISYNHPAISFYKKMSFTLLRRLHKFYYINDQHYDSYLFVYHVNGGRSPCSPIEIMTAVMTYFRGLINMIVMKLRRSEEKNIHRWSKCKESGSLLHIQNMRVIDSENEACQCV